MGPQNSLVGDSNPYELPVKPSDDKDTSEIKNRAKYSRSTEWKNIEAFCLGKIAKYQTTLPNGQHINDGIPPTAEDWRVANRVIADLLELMSLYNSADEYVQDAENA